MKKIETSGTNVVVLSEEPLTLGCPPTGRVGVRISTDDVGSFVLFARSPSSLRSGDDADGVTNCKRSIELFENIIWKATRTNPGHASKPQDLPQRSHQKNFHEMQQV